MHTKEAIKRICTAVVSLFLLTGFFFTGVSAQSETNFHEVASTVMINKLKSHPAKSFLPTLYRDFFYVPLWVSESSPSPLSASLFEQMKSDKTLERSSRLYQRMEQLEEKMGQLYASGTATVYDKVAIEFQVSKLYKEYADYTIYGSINWGAFQARIYNLKANSIHAGWDTYRPKISPLLLLEYAVNSSNVQKAFQKAEPKKYGYRQLKAELVKYLQIEKKGGWEPVEFQGALKPGKMHEIVPVLRQRLHVEGDYKECGTDETSTDYDTCLKNAVIRFQKRNGLPAEGIVGKLTRAALNITVQERIQTIRLNLDRIKWLKARRGSRHIIINIPAFTLFFEENGKLRESIKVITGTKKHPSPIFSNTVRHIVLNPYWNVPKSIIQNEMIPELLRNPNAMARKNIVIYSGWGSDARQVSGGSVNWGEYRYSKNMPFRFAQLPGKGNALGKVKFLFPNHYSVYMHDTPTKHLFKRDVRAFSHGCIRLGRPIKLLQTFSSFNKSVDFTKSEKILKGKTRTQLDLDTTVPVDVVYLTAWVDYDGVLQFRNDIYDYDKMQLNSFKRW